MNLPDLTVDYTSGDPARLAAADQRARGLLAEWGCCVATGLLGDAALDPMRAGIRRLLHLRAHQAGVPLPPAKEFDAGLWELRRVDAAHRNEVISVLPYLPAFQQLTLHPNLLRASRALMGTEDVLATRHHALRHHWPHEDYLLPWHQDYPHIQDSEDALVYWVPLRAAGPGSSGLRLALGSHRAGVRRTRGEGPRRDHGHRALRLADPDEAERYPQTVISVNAGDVLVLSTLLLHASSPNRADQISWSLHIRHGNYAHPRTLARGWPIGRMSVVPFGRSHPEYYEDGPEVAGGAS